MDADIWDVFTDRPLAGNALAVLPDAGGLTDDAMQRVAREFDLSETVFVLPGPEGRPRLRIFTPARELPMAGHPTIGAAFALDRRGRLHGDRATVELGIGPVALDLERAGDGRLLRVWMDQARPRRLATLDDRPGVARALGLDVADLAPRAPLEVWSAGVPYLVVALRDLDALGRARLTLERLGPSIDPDHRAVLAFVAGEGGGSPRCRVFGEAVGVVEDPGTGSAHGPLGAYLVRHGLVEAPPAGGTTVLQSRQGVEMGRPSTLHLRLRALPAGVAREEGRADVAVEVGGAAVPVLEGRLSAFGGAASA